MSENKSEESICMYARIRKLVELVSAGDFPSKKDLAQNLGVSLSTIGRDMEFFNGYCRKYQIVFDCSHNGYLIEELIYK